MVQDNCKSRKEAIFVAFHIFACKSFDLELTVDSTHAYLVAFAVQISLERARAILSINSRKKIFYKKRYYNLPSHHHQ